MSEIVRVNLNRRLFVAGSLTADLSACDRSSR